MKRKIYLVAAILLILPVILIFGYVGLWRKVEPRLKIVHNMGDDVKVVVQKYDEQVEVGPLENGSYPILYGRYILKITKGKDASHFYYFHCDAGVKRLVTFEFTDSGRGRGTAILFYNGFKEKVISFDWSENRTLETATLLDSI